MGQVNSKNIISGAVANLVFRNLNGKQVVQVHPGKLRQTKATKASGSEFRQCSSWAKQLRTGLSPFLVDLTDSYMYRRLTGALYNTLLGNTNLPKGKRTPLNANMKGLEGFDFNSHSPFDTYFTPRIEALLNSQQQIEITIPKLDPKRDIQFPQHIDNAELVVLVQATNFDDSTLPAETFFVLPIEHHTALPDPTTWTSPILPDGHLVLVTAKLLFYEPNKFTGKNYINSKTLNPALVVFCEATGN